MRVPKITYKEGKSMSSGMFNKFVFSQLKNAKLLALQASKFHVKGV